MKATIALGPSGISTGAGKVMVNKDEGLPCLIVHAMVKGNIEFTLCLTESAVNELERAIGKYREALASGALL